MVVWFDMDNTLNRFYEVDNWLEYLINEDTTPYRIAKVALNMSLLARLLHKLQNKGIQIGIISWLSKNGTKEYNQMVTKEKIIWLKTHLTSIQFDYINIIEYGVPKQNYMISNNDILFDDEKPNRANWQGVAYEPKDIINILKELIKTRD